MNDTGEYFIGNKVIKSTTGEEEIFDAPVTSVTGEDENINTTFTDSVNISGGTNKDVLSTFDGPTVFSNKITSTSSDGIEAVSVQLQGDAKVARKVTVGIATPSVGGAAGDITFSSKPTESGYAGWVYTSQNTWRRFGLVSHDEDSTVVSVDKIGIGTTNPQSQLDIVGTFQAVNFNATGIITAAKLVVTGVTTLATTTVDDDLTFKGQTTARNVVWDKSDDALEFADYAKARFGDGTDLQIYHDTNHSYLEQSGTGSLRLGYSGTTELYSGTSKKLETLSGGISITGVATVSSGATCYGDIRAGNSSSSGLILVSPNGSTYRVGVDNSGNLSASSV